MTDFSTDLPYTRQLLTSTDNLNMSSIDPSQYQALLNEKEQRIAAQFSNFELPELKVHASQPQNFRLRAEFRIWHLKEEDRCHYAMSEPGDKNKIYEVTEFPIASKLINELMPKLLAELNATQELKHRLFQAEFLTTISGDALITLIYHRQLGDEWRELALKLQEKLGVSVIGRARKQKIVLDRDYVIEKLDVAGQEYIYKQIEGGFTQPNGQLNQTMLSWAQECSVIVNPDKSHDLVEMYCGNGNFSVALAGHYNRVMATEISKTSVYAAQYNIEQNNIDNLIVARLSSEEFVQALQGERKFRRLEDIELDGYDFKSTLVDPPRAGLDAESVKQTQSYDNIIYISCNPETLHDNLLTLTETHEIKRFALFDQFPYTHHIECGVLLTRKSL